jgi:ribonuclease HII
VERGVNAAQEKMQFPTYKYETKKFQEGYTLIAGCDEVGVAPLAGPVVAAAVILDPASISGKRTKSKWWYRVRDSKTVNEKERNSLVEFIKDHCLAFGQGTVSHETIDELNIHHASLSAMKEAVDSLSVKPDFLFLDGNHKLNQLNWLEQEAVVDGDAKILSISAASIIAKVARDKMLNELHRIYPHYDFHRNKGYPTKFHRDALVKHGACPVHRRSFNLVKLALSRVVV